MQKPPPPPLDRCPLCGSADIRNRFPGGIDPARLKPEDFRITDSRYGRSWRFDRCRRCGYVFANPPADAEALLRFYSDLTDDEYGQERENRAKNFRVVLKRLRRLAPGAASLLDVGAASGIFLDLARRQGYAATGVEPSAALADEARERYGIELFRGTLDGFPADRRFDVVTLLDIIEHVPSPDDLLAGAASRLNPGGVLVIVTPDIGSLAARLGGKRWWHLRVAHIRFFCRRSLYLLLHKHGLRPLLQRRYAWNFSLHYLLSRLLPRLKKPGPLQNLLKKLNLRLQLGDSLEVYAGKKDD